MARVVLDSSALLAVVNREAGCDAVAAVIGDAVMSAVNHAEVVGKLVERLGSLELVREVLSYAGVEVVEFDRQLAEETGDLIRRTRPFGLSLGDRSCLALAARERLPVMTADRAWSQLGIDVEIRLVR